MQGDFEGRGLEKMLVGIHLAITLAVLQAATGSWQVAMALGFLGLTSALVLFLRRRDGKRARWEQSRSMLTVRVLTVAEGAGGRITRTRLMHRVMVALPGAAVLEIDRVLMELEAYGMVTREEADDPGAGLLVFPGLESKPVTPAGGLVEPPGVWRESRS
jgi:hypothetical protein